MDYLTWNDLIASHFFRSEKAGQKVFLYVNDQVLRDLSGTIQADPASFVEAVKTGPPGIPRLGLCQMALRTLETWRSGRRNYPPYIAYLGLFVMAAGIEGDFSPIAYYPRLRTLLGEESNSRPIPSFDRMWELWFDLESWSNQDKRGSLGVFSVTFAFRRWIHIGLPVAQTLLTNGERGSLPGVFADAQLDPVSPPSDRELAKLLIMHGRNELEPRTLRLLEGVGRDDDARRAVLVELVLDELRDWDGTAPTSGVFGGQTDQIYGSLNLFGQLDETAESARMTLRCRTRHDFPEDGLVLSLPGRSDLMRCDEAALGWSTALRPESDGPPIDAASFDWSDGLRATDPDQRWIFNLPPSSIRIFVYGLIYEMSGIVETRRLPAGSPFYLAAREDSQDLIRRWGRSGCVGFRELSIVRGLPEGWSLFYADAAQSDDMVKREYPLLALPSTIRLSFDGGIRVSRGQQFFKFAPPRLVVEGGNNSLEVYCNEMRLEPMPLGMHTYELPPTSLDSGEVALEARQGDDVFTKRLFLVEDLPVSADGLVKQFGRFGDRHTESGDGIASAAGSLITGFAAPPFDFARVVNLREEGRVFYLGREPGQVVNWPSEALPTSWVPVWAVPMRQSGRAIFCGTSVSASEPTESRCDDQKKLKEWKEILWYRRKLITEPRHISLRSLWKRFQKEAQRV